MREQLIIPQAFRPYLVALSVADLAASVRWYQQHLDFALVSQNEYPDYHLAMAMMERDGYKLELIQHGSSISADSLLPDKDNPATLQGIVKLAFWVEDVRAKAAHFETLGVTFKMEPRHDQEENTISFIVTDNSNNWIQFLGIADHL